MFLYVTTCVYKILLLVIHITHVIENIIVIYDMHGTVIIYLSC